MFNIDATDGALGRFIARYGVSGLALLGVVYLIYVAHFSPTDQATMRQDLMQRVVTLQQRVDKQQERIEQQQVRIAQLEADKRASEADLDAMRLRMVLMEGTQGSLPWPAWTKDRSGVVVSANEAYERTFLRDRGYTLLDYVGHDDFAVWPTEIAQAYRANDARVMRTKQMEIFEESVQLASGKVITMPFVKYPVVVNGGVLGVSGMAVPTRAMLDLLR